MNSKSAKPFFFFLDLRKVDKATLCWLIDWWMIGHAEVILLIQNCNQNVDVKVLHQRRNQANKNNLHRMIRAEQYHWHTSLQAHTRVGVAVVAAAMVISLARIIRVLEQVAPEGDASGATTSPSSCAVAARAPKKGRVKDPYCESVKDGKRWEESLAVSILANGGEQPMSSQGFVSFLRVITTARPDARYMSYCKTNVHVR
jgi:hypothetical protein